MEAEGPRQSRRAQGRRRAGQPEGAGARRPSGSAVCRLRDLDRAGDPPRRARLPAHALPRRPASPRRPPTSRSIAAIASVFLPGGQPLAAGDLLVQRDYAETLRLIARARPRRRLWRRARPTGSPTIWRAPARSSASRISTTYRTIEREPVRGTYRGVEIVGPPPPCSGGVHTIQILNMLEAYDIGRSASARPRRCIWCWRR